MASKTTLANFTLPLAGFANPRYIAADPTDAIGHDISSAVAVAISVISMGTNTVVAEQTFHRTALPRTSIRSVSSSLPVSRWS